ncbi:MAG: HAMP domain-containing sensor histidine kinase [Pseudomonadota bacterium]
MEKWFYSLSVSAKILLAFLFLTLIFTATSGYSLLKHRKTASDLRLMSGGYLKMAFAIMEMRATQKLQTVQFEQMIDEEDQAVVLGWISSIRRIRPIVLDKLGKDVDDLMKLTGRQEEKLFLTSVKSDIEDTQELYVKAEELYQTLLALLEGGISREVEEVWEQIRDQERKIESNLRHLQSISVQRIHTVTARSEQAETRTLWMLSALILLTVSISLLTTYLIHRLLKPLGELRKGVEIIGKGNLDYRVNVRRMDETGRFAHQLNAMAAALQERDRRLILSERLAATGKIASHIAHEVKNPLSSIGLNTELVMEEAKEVPDETKRKEIFALTRSISVEVDRVTSLINHYLQLGRPPKPQMAETNLVGFLEEVKTFMAQELKENEVELDINAPDRPVMAEVDRDQIRQVIVNLLKNAIEAMENVETRKIVIGLTRGGSQAEIVVSDTGKGMSREERESIFEPFFSSKKGGSGLGLAVSRRIILDHKGNIQCDSKMGKGTQFTITLPV